MFEITTTEREKEGLHAEGNKMCSQSRVLPMLPNGILPMELVYGRRRDKSRRGIYVGEARKASRRNYYEPRETDRAEKRRPDALRRKTEKRFCVESTAEADAGPLSLGAFPCQTLPVFLSASIVYRSLGPNPPACSACRQLRAFHLSLTPDLYCIRILIPGVLEFTPQSKLEHPLRYTINIQLS